MTIERLRVFENHLLPLVVITGVVGLLVPQLGQALAPAVTVLLAVLMFAVSLTFDVHALRMVLRRPGTQLLATVLVYVPMSMIAFGLATAALRSGPLWLGFILLGVLPTDVSSPLLVWIGRGNVALATVFNAINTGLAPVFVPLLFVAYTGVALDFPVGTLIMQLATIILVPTTLGIAIRTWKPQRVHRFEPALSATGSLCYLALLLAVIGPNADAMIAAPVMMLVLVALCLGLNVAGYGLATLARPLLPDRGDWVAMLFTVSKKEFSIAAVVVIAAGLPAEVALPAVVYAVVQMVTSPLAARALAARTPMHPRA